MLHIYILNVPLHYFILSQNSNRKEIFAEIVFIAFSALRAIYKIMH